MKQIGSGVGVAFKRETLTPTLGQNPDSGGLRLRLNTPALNCSRLVEV